MQRINIYALKKHRKKILEALQRRGVVQVEDLDLEDSVFAKEETSQKQNIFMKTSVSASQAAAIINEYLPEKISPFAMFEGRKSLTVNDYYTFVDDSSEIMRVAYEVIAAKKSISDNKAEIIRLESQIESLKPWQSLDISMRFVGTDHTKAFIGILPELVTYEQVMEKLASLAPNAEGVSLEIISSSQEQTCIFLMCASSCETEIAAALKEMGFSRPPLPSKFTPSQRIDELKGRIKDCEKIIESNIENIKIDSGMKNAFLFMEDYYVMRAEKYAVIEKLQNSKRTFILTGYVPLAIAEPLQRELTEGYEAVTEIEDLKPDETPPVLLKNNKLASPVESVLETYSLPKKGEIDPTAIMAFFYYIFFGMMFSDAGYGIIMTLGCAFVLLKFKNIEEGLKKSVKMFLYCGISTTFWGFMYGSFFGDAVTIIGKVYFNADVAIQPIWFDPVKGSNSMTLLMVCFLFGIIHLFVGLGIKAYMYIKDGKFLDAIYDVLSWYLLVGGGILALLSLDMMKSMTGFVLPPVFLTIGGICAAIGALLIILFDGRGSSPVKRILKGIYALYGATGYLSDILSYSRLLALGLSTGVIAQVFNQIGSMFGPGIGVIPFALVMIVGHSLNIGINALGAYVHTNRLQFVEFFGKFYEGGGVKFAPFKINTKHYKVKEEI